MADRQLPQTNRRLVRFWLLFWPMLIAGMLVALLLLGLILPIGLYFTEGEEALLAWLGGNAGVRTALFPAVLAAAILAGRCSGADAFPVGFASTTGLVLGCIGGFLHDGAIATALIGAGTGIAGAVAMWGIGYGFRRLWPGDTGGGA